MPRTATTPSKPTGSRPGTSVATTSAAPPPLPFQLPTKTSYSGQVSRALAYARSFEDPDWQTAFTKISKHTPEVLLANEELTRLQIKDIDRDLTTDTGSPYFTITLTFRKTNQADVTKANVYQIHPQPGTHRFAAIKNSWSGWIGWRPKGVNYSLTISCFLRWMRRAVSSTKKPCHSLAYKVGLTS
ncbi:hypothetical protein K457DRAFT_23571 [Linnemannia elongata AG-77]|uniref:Uncharacterized protein n=1 Tax=Linnemannia elongata AG-77 TaxID=1314771 RepID=A0A197JIH4_9FUNG|nr:hypothetical protein K457DRAFT_23571 [Linnemannia elongata AG-77]